MSLGGSTVGVATTPALGSRFPYARYPFARANEKTVCTTVTKASVANAQKTTRAAIGQVVCIHQRVLITTKGRIASLLMFLITGLWMARACRACSASGALNAFSSDSRNSRLNCCASAPPWRPDARPPLHVRRAPSSSLGVIGARAATACVFSAAGACSTRATCTPCSSTRSGAAPGHSAPIRTRSAHTAASLRPSARPPCGRPLSKGLTLSLPIGYALPIG